MPTGITPSEVLDPNSTRALYEEALAERFTSDREAAKRLIASRIKEVDRLKVLLAKAEGELALLLEKDVAQICLLSDVVTGGRKFTLPEWAEW